MSKQKQDFILMRAEGISFEKIAKQLKISKPTAVKWGRLYQSEINDLVFTAMTEIKEQYLQSKKRQYEKLLKHLAKVDDAIEQMELTNANIKDLWLIRNDITEQIAKIEKSTSYTNTNLVQKNIMGEDETVSVKLDEV